MSQEDAGPARWTGPESALPWIAFAALPWAGLGGATAGAYGEPEAAGFAFAFVAVLLAALLMAGCATWYAGIRARPFAALVAALSAAVIGLLHLLMSTPGMVEEGITVTHAAWWLFFGLAPAALVAAMVARGLRLSYAPDAPRPVRAS